MTGFLARATGTRPFSRRQQRVSLRIHARDDTEIV